jgi:hypothetical protein
MNELIKLESVELSESDLKRLLKSGFRFMPYPELSKYVYISQLLKKDGDYFILFFETTSSTAGHYQCCWMMNGLFHFWDSYGLTPNGDKKYLQKNVLVKLNEFKPYLPDLINESADSWDYNTIDYQSWKGSVATCGRHVACRLYHRKLGEQEYYNTMMNYIKQNKLKSFDEAVTLITYRLLGK